MTPTGASSVSAIVTAHERLAQTLTTIEVLLSRVPAPGEVLVHLGSTDNPIAEAIRHKYPAVRILTTSHAGPGGARNALVAAARYPIVASFDDDSYPIDHDYFQRVEEMFSAFPRASIVTARIFHLHDTVEPPRRTAEWGADFSGGACAYRRQSFIDVGGYVPLADAYNMEEVDFALRLHAQGGKVLSTPWLRVFHDTDLGRHAEPSVTSASIANIALLTFLRYPVSMWVVGAMQCAKRVMWLVGHGRHRGIIHGLVRIPSLLRAHKTARRVVSARAFRSYLRLRRHPIAVGFAD